MSTIGIFPRLEIETSSYCNRTCKSCLRNSIPDRESTQSWFDQNLLPTDDFKRILLEAKEMGFSGELCLSHYNEPLLDKRIVELAQFARNTGFSRIFFCSNADFLTEELAKNLDGLIDDIGFSFYMDEPIKSKRREWVYSLFKRTKLVGTGDGEHMITHFSPLADVVQISLKYKNNPCFLPQKRMIINHKGQMLLCCDDLTGHFDLGTIYEYSLKELWYSEKHQLYLKSLMKSGGRGVHQHCLSCPRP